MVSVEFSESAKLCVGEEGREGGMHLDLSLCVSVSMSWSFSVESLPG